MGDDETFRQQLVDIAPHLRAFARSLCGDRDLADDLAQDALMKAIAAASGFQPGTNFRAWMFTILRNLYYSEYRKRRRRQPSEDENALEKLSTPAPQHARLEIHDVRVALDQLRSEYREALILVGASGFSYEEAADIVGCAVGTVKSRVSRARAELERLLDAPASERANGPAPRRSRAKSARAVGG
ncbi:MAG: sigma-70 family RNA polymerase sigma factor [Pseudomonadota bacterium]